MVNTPRSITPYSGAHYFVLGWRLITRPGLKRYVVMPLLVNILLMGSAFWWLLTKIEGWMGYLMSHIPDWLQWISYLLWPLAVLSILLIGGYFFSTITNFIAAPFCGLLAEKVEINLTGNALNDAGVIDLLKDTPRIVAREWHKLAYYFPRALILLLIYLLPGVGQIIAPILWFLFSAWMMAIQYCDYPFDNHKISLVDMRQSLRQNKSNTLQFGALVNLCTMVPFVNLVILPVAVCGATAMWVDYYRAHAIKR